MHQVDQTTEQMVRSVLAYAENRLRMDPVPLDRGTQSAADLYRVLDGVIRDEGRAPDELPPRLIEENMWRAIRYGLSGELIDLERGDVLPARERIERLIEWVLPVASEIGAAEWLRIPERNAAERQIARFAESGDLAEIYGDLVIRPSRVG